MKKIFIVLVMLQLLFLVVTYGHFDQGQANSIQDAEKIQEYDVVVIGGDPEGVAAAISAARNGSKTLLIEKRNGLGGLFTYGKMNVLDFPHGLNKHILKSPVFSEWHHLVGEQKSFEIAKAKDAFLKMVLAQKNLTLSLNTNIQNIQIDDGSSIITFLSIQQANRNYTIKAHKFIDATQDADIATLSGVPYFIGGEDVGYKNRWMAVTLMIHLNNINWDKIKEVAQNKTFGEAKVTNEAAWGFVKLRELYRPKDPNIRLRGLNLIRNNEGYYINALQIFGVNGLDETSKQAGIERGKKETSHILSWLQNHFPGFENATIASYPSELYIRETRHIHSLYQLPVSDLWENKYHWDTIAFGGYPADIQATAVNDPGAIVVNPTQYSIPFRSLVPKKITNLLVVGRSGGYSSLAQGSVRIVATGMATGEAAGAASALAMKKNLDFHSMAANKQMITELQHRLQQQGIQINKFDVSYPYEDQWYYPAIRELLNRRALFGGYQNDLEGNKYAENQFLTNILLHLYRAELSKHPGYEENIHYLNEYNKTNATKDLTANELMQIISGLPTKHLNDIKLDETLLSANKQILTREDIYIIVGKLFNWL